MKVLSKMAGKSMKVSFSPIVEEEPATNENTGDIPRQNGNKASEDQCLFQNSDKRSKPVKKGRFTVTTLADIESDTVWVPIQPEEEPDAEGAIEDEVDGVRRSESYNMAVNPEESYPLLAQSNHKMQPNASNSHFLTIPPSPESQGARGDFYSANIGAMFQNNKPSQKMENKNPRKPHLKIDIEKANKNLKPENAFKNTDIPLEIACESQEVNREPVSSQCRRGSKMFTVINYGRVSPDAISPAGSTPHLISPESKANKAKFSWPKQVRLLNIFSFTP